jgi:hypothetical protein
LNLPPLRPLKLSPIYFVIAGTLLPLRSLRVRMAEVIIWPKGGCSEGALLGLASASDICRHDIYLNLRRYDGNATESKGNTQVIRSVFATGPVPVHGERQQVDLTLRYDEKGTKFGVWICNERRDPVFNNEVASGVAPILPRAGAPPPSTQ